MPFVESLAPVCHRSGRNGESGGYDLSGAARSAPSTGPRKKRENSSGRANMISEIKVVSTGIIEVNRAFHQSETQKFRIKVEVRLGIAGYRSDVMDTVQLHA